MSLVQHTPTARERALYSPQVLRALDPSPAMPEAVRYALVTAKRGAKPWAYPDLPALAARIHRDRGVQALQLLSARYRFADGVRAVIQVLAMDPVSTRTRTLGFAWISGRPAEALMAALDVQAPAVGGWEG